MAPLPYNSTDIAFVDYSNAIGQHTLQVRTDPAVTFAAIGTSIKALLNALTAEFSLSTVIATRYRNAGAGFAYSVDLGMNAFTWGSAAANPESNATALTFVGRSSGGRRTRVSIFGYKNGLSAYRLLPAESSGVTSALAILRGQPGIYLAVDNQTVIWQSYADVKANDYWVRRARG